MNCGSSGETFSIFLFPGWTRAIRAGRDLGAGRQEEREGEEERKGYGRTQEGSGYGECFFGSPRSPSGPLPLRSIFMVELVSNQHHLLLDGHMMDQRRQHLSTSDTE